MEDIVIKSSLDAIGLKTTWCDINNIRKARVLFALSENGDTDWPEGLIAWLIAGN